MGIVKTIMGLRFRRAVAPYQVTSNISPQENYAGYTSLPNLPMSHGDYDPNPQRLHAPFQVERENRRLYTNAGVVMFDAANESVIEIPDSDLQNYFNQKKTVDPQVVLVPANGVEVPTAQFQSGWSQSFVPQAGMRVIESGASPAVYLSKPIQVTTFVNEGKRAPISKATSHPAKRGR